MLKSLPHKFNPFTVPNSMDSVFFSLFEIEYQFFFSAILPYYIHFHIKNSLDHIYVTMCEGNNCIVGVG